LETFNRGDGGNSPPDCRFVSPNLCQPASSNFCVGLDSTTTTGCVCMVVFVLAEDGVDAGGTVAPVFPNNDIVWAINSATSSWPPEDISYKRRPGRRLTKMSKKYVKIGGAGHFELAKPHPKLQNNPEQQITTTSSQQLPNSFSPFHSQNQNPPPWVGGATSKPK
jgi:hypothetical protein